MDNLYIIHCHRCEKRMESKDPCVGEIVLCIECSHTCEVDKAGIYGSTASVRTLTNQLRWKKTSKITYGMFAKPDFELQQMWRSDKGEEKWEPIECVD